MTSEQRAMVEAELARYPKWLRDRVKSITEGKRVADVDVSGHVRLNFSDVEGLPSQLAHEIGHIHYTSAGLRPEGSVETAFGTRMAGKVHPSKLEELYAEAFEEFVTGKAPDFSKVPASVRGVPMRETNPALVDEAIAFIRELGLDIKPKGGNPMPEYPIMSIPKPYSFKVRAELRKIPTWKLLEAYELLTSGMDTGIAIVEQNRAHCTSAIREILFERGKAPPEPVLGNQLLKTLITRTINDITHEQMSRIVSRLGRMPVRERGVPKRVADVLADELGPQKALQYLDKALEAGQIKIGDYDEMRSALILPMPRADIPYPTVRRMAADLVRGQQGLKSTFNQLSVTGQKALRKPVEDLNADVKRLRKAWRV